MSKHLKWVVFFRFGDPVQISQGHFSLIPQGTILQWSQPLRLGGNWHIRLLAGRRVQHLA